MPLRKMIKLQCKLWPCLAILNVWSTPKRLLGRRGRMVVRYITTYVISAYHHERCEFESWSGEVYSIQHYVMKFVSDLRQVGGFLLVLRFTQPIKLTGTIWNIVENGVKHYKRNQTESWIYSRKSWKACIYLLPLNYAMLYHHSIYNSVFIIIDR